MCFSLFLKAVKKYYLEFIVALLQYKIIKTCNNNYQFIVSNLLINTVYIRGARVYER